MSVGVLSISSNNDDKDIEWKINGFTSLSKKDDAGYFSPYLYFCGERWQLSISPNGSSGRNSLGHIDLCLWKESSWVSSCVSVRLECSLSIKTLKGEKEHEVHCTDLKVMDYHALNRFIPRSELFRRRSELMPDNALTVVCNMKNTTSARSAKGVSTVEINKSDVAETSTSEASGSNRTVTSETKESEEGVSTVEVNKSDVAGPSKSDTYGSNQIVASETKESVLKWIKDNCKESSKGKKRKIEKDNVLKWIEENCKETSKGKKRKMEEDNGEVSASGSSISPHEKKLHDDLKELFLKKEDCDIIIKVKGLEIPAHRVILKARSPVFASIFRHNMKESATGIVEIEDCDPSSFSDFLKFLYYGDIRMISQENVFSLFTMADKYEVLDLRAKCLDFMKENMTVDTFCETITMALQHSETELIALATDFFVKNAEEILQTVKWQTFVVKSPTQSNELFIKFVKTVKHSNV